MYPLLSNLLNLHRLFVHPPKPNSQPYFHSMVTEYFLQRSSFCLNLSQGIQGLLSGSADQCAFGFLKLVRAPEVAARKFRHRSLRQLLVFLSQKTIAFPAILPNPLSQQNDYKKSEAKWPPSLGRGRSCCVHEWRTLGRTYAPTSKGVSGRLRTVFWEEIVEQVVWFQSSLSCRPR